MTAYIITIGDEILIGQITDTNSVWIAQQLNLNGIVVKGMATVGDEKQDIQAALERGLQQAEVVLCTGGLGPTRDDITKKALAEYFQVGFVFSQETFSRLVKRFERRGRMVRESHRQQCLLPQNATVLTNEMGTAPGMWFEQQGTVVVSMPGIPYEMKYLMEYEVIPRLKQQFPLTPIAHRTILTAGDGETGIAARIEAFENNLPKGIKLAYLPNLGVVRLRLSGTGTDEKLLNDLLDTKVEELKALLPDHIFGYERETLSEAVGKILIQQNKTLSTAESCTGGYLAHLITAISGSSAYFQGSIIAYSNKVKMEQLGVNQQTLQQYGAVSEETVKQMVKGVVATLNTDVGIAISGIAGPTGGTPDKPVGTIWLAVGSKNQIVTEKLQLGHDRIKNIHYTSIQALNLLRRFLQTEH